MERSDYLAIGAAAVVVVFVAVGICSSASNRNEILKQLENSRGNGISSVDEIKTLLGDLPKRLEELHGKVETLEKAAANGAAFAKDAKPHLDNLPTWLENLHGKIESMEAVAAKEATFAQDVKNSLAALPAQFKTLQDRIDSLYGTVATNATTAAATANTLRQAQNHLQKNFDGLLGKVNALDGSVKAASSAAKESAKAMQQKIDGLPNQFKAVQGKMDTLDKKITLVASGADASLGNGDKAAIAKAGLAAQLAQVNACTQNIDSCKDPRGYFPEDVFPLVTILIQTASDAVGRAGTLDKSLIGADGVKKLQNAAYEVAIREDHLGLSRSLKTVAKIESLISEANKLLTGANSIPAEYQPSEQCYYTACINEIQTKLSDMYMLLQTLYERNPSKHKEKLADFEKLQKGLQELVVMRTRRYQEHVIYWCGDTIKQKFDKEMATRQINGTFSKVDTSLLHPQVAALYQEVLGKLLSQFSDDDRLKMEIKIAQERKWSLEDF